MSDTMFDAMFGAAIAGGSGGSGFTPTEQQLTAMNSGITSTDVDQITMNKNNISSFYPTAYQSLEPAVDDVTVLSGGYIQIGNVIIVLARISITSDQTGNMFHNMPNAVATAAFGQAVAPINATAVSASTNDTNLIFLNSEIYKGVIAVAGNHNKISAGIYVISGMYLSAD